jgi:hypothetical protein
MISPTSRHHPFRVLALLAIPALLAAGCGGPPSNGNQANQFSEVQALKWTQCMQQHGVTRAKATSNGHGGSVAVPAPGQPGGPSQQQLQTAQQACKQYQPNGGQGNSRPPSAQQLDQNQKYVQCLNQHGVPAQLTDNGNGVKSGGPNIDPNTQQRADQACQKYQPQH